MKGILKILLGLIGGLVLLLVLAAVVLPLIYDKDDLKQAIAAQVHKQTGRDLHISGALDFSVFPWLAVNVGDLSLSNAEGFGDQPFARIGKLRAGVALMPLFKKQLVVDEITLDGLQLALAVNSRGENNWDDLAAQEKDQATDAGAPGSDNGLFSNQSIAGLNIRDAQIEYQDQKSKTHYRLNGFSLQTGALGDGKPVPVELGGMLEDVGAGSRVQISLATTAAIDIAAKNHTFDDVELAIKQLAVDGPGDQGAQDEAIIIRSPRVTANLAAETLALETLTARVAGLEVAGNFKANHLFGKPAFEGALQIDEFSPRKLMQALSLEVPATADPEVLQRASLSTSLKGDASQLTLNNFQGDLDQSHFSGEMSVRNFDRPGIRFDLNVDAIDLDRYLEPASEETAAQASDVAMPGEELKDLDVQGSLRVGTLQLAGLNFSDAKVDIHIINGRLTLNPLTAGFYDGSYRGNITLDGSGSTPVLSLDEKLDSVTFQQLVADITDSKNLSGLAQGHVRLTGRGATSSEVLGSLKGDLGLTLDEGALEGVNIWYEIRRGYALFKGLAAPKPEPRRTVFSRMQVDAMVENGLLTTRELAADLPFLSIRGGGTVNLGQSDVNLRLTAIVRSAPELAQDPLAADLQGKQLPFKITGLLTDPEISIDFAKLLKSEATGALLDKLGLKPKPAPAEETADDQQQLSGKDQTREAAKGLLFDLLGGKDKKQDKQEED